MIEKENLNFRNSLFDDEEKFIKNILFSSTQIIKNSDFEKYGMTNKNIMFFLNYITETISSISMLGCRNTGISLIGKTKNIIDYYKNIVELYDNAKIPKTKSDYIINSIKNNSILLKTEQARFLKFLSCNNDKEFIENVKLIYNSLISNQYFERVSDKLYELLTEENNDFDKIEIYTQEYFALLIDYVGISIYEIKRIIRDCYREFFRKKRQDVFLQLFEKLAETYEKNNKYLIFIKMDRSFDERLLTSLKQSQNNNYVMYSKTGFERKILDEKVNNQKILNRILEEFVENSNDNNYFISIMLEAKDIWHAIKEFRQKTIQPFIGSMLYSGINVNTQSDYIVIEQREGKKFINKYKYYDDIFKPLSQDRINYSDVFKRYVIETSENDIK